MVHSHRYREPLFSIVLVPVPVPFLVPVPVLCSVYEPQGGARDMRPRVRILSISCSFWEILQIGMLAPLLLEGRLTHFWEILDPSLVPKVRVCVSFLCLSVALLHLL